MNERQKCNKREKYKSASCCTNCTSLLNASFGINITLLLKRNMIFLLFKFLIFAKKKEGI